MNPDILKFLIDKKYYVSIKNTQDNLYLVEFPNNDEVNVPARKYQYYLLGLELIVTRLNDRKNFTLILEDYEIRPIILADILIKTNKRKISPELIITIKDDKKVKMFDTLPVPSNISRETHLLNFIEGYLTNIRNYSIIEKYNLQSSFDKFINIYDSEGIL